MATTGSLPNHTPGQAYTGTFGVTGASGNITAELVSSTPPLPAGWSLAVNQATDQVTLAWPGAPVNTLLATSLLRFNGANGSTVFTDETGKIWTRTGTPTITTAISTAFDGASGNFSGTTDRIDCTSSDFNFGTGDFTVEIWTTGGGGATQSAFSFGGHLVYFAGAQPAYFFGGSNRIVGSSRSPIRGPFNHLALVRKAGVISLFFNGFREGTFNDASAINAGTMRVGWWSAGIPSTANHDEFRVVAGTALYDGPTYTVPTSRFELGGGGGGTSTLPNLDFESGDSNWTKGNRWAIDTTGLKDGGTWSAKYDGPGQSTLQHVQAVPVTPGTTITASCRISKGNNREDFAGGAVVLQWLDSTYTPISFNVGNVVNTGSSAFQTSTVTATAPAGSAFVRLAASGTRDTRGRARDKVYADNFTWNHSYSIPEPPGTDYDVVIRVRDGRGCQSTLSQTIKQGLPQTLALLHFDGANGSTSFPDDTGRVWTRSGNTQVSTTNPRFGTGSAQFDGVDDWLETPIASGLAFGTGPFTVELWVRLTAVGNFPNLLSCRGGASAPLGWYLRVGNNGRVQYGLGSGAAGLINSLVTVNDGLWHHIAIVRSGISTTMFVDGVMQGAPVNFNDNFTVPNMASTLRIGASTFAAASAEDLNGNIDELRISNVARYTANFTPPSAPLPLD